MKNYYEVGKVYVWIPERLGKGYEYLANQETTVIGNTEEFKTQNGNIKHGQLTDTPENHIGRFFATPGSLRPKNPPTGEKTIYEIISGKLHVKEEEETC